MKIIISPAKTMIDATDDFIGELTPQFLKEAKYIFNVLKNKNLEDLKTILKTNNELTRLNYDRLQNNDLEVTNHMAIMSYKGLQFQNLNAHLMSKEEITYLNDNLIILSGLYGAIRPNDKIIHYRLEMASRINVLDYKNLYKYWEKPLNEFFKDELIINLASKEYSDVLINQNMINIHFKVKSKNKIVSKATLAKMARGTMVRYLASNQIYNYEEIKKFNELNFKFDEELSTVDNYVFIKEE